MGDPGSQKGSSTYASHPQMPTTRSVQQTHRKCHLAVLAVDHGLDDGWGKGAVRQVPSRRVGPNGMGSDPCCGGGAMACQRFILRNVWRKSSRSLVTALPLDRSSYETVVGLTATMIARICSCFQSCPG